ncbi:tRNA nucleotidyltransferase (CCA-adding enzyme) [Desulfosarcina sp. BuS5]|uniref:CBS domain-containing protein n=1 Tax=Desulfosarcina sp. BuS5 TaxID=933262 RepID=UPI000486024F|nr:CBS domain-containing protein [Desulfosarcina sp. BuS5]WDN88331.1 tRNA nucleotidyltransferase (CCA-adding enzyme) [Desulfosarcina sp. BuS5]
MEKNKKLTIITTHINADYDAMASMLAAQKLYPGSLLVFPRFNEKNLRNFFIQSMGYLFNMADIKSIDVDRIERLVLVDTRQPGRIGDLAVIAEKKEVQIHIYDHHPPMPNDIKGDYEVLELTGSAVAILTEIIKNKGIDISADEATVMSLGIYEDTGSFTYSSTTEKDFLAAAFLISRGANLNIVSQMIAREINSEQVGLLNDLIQAALHNDINGIDIVISSVITDTYIPDIAFLVQKMMNMERLDVIIAIVQMENKIYVVARSRLSEVDVGSILALIGGGGHAYAAAATIRDKTISQIEHQLFELLYKNVKPLMMAKNIMSSPPITIDADISCQDANDLLTRYNVNALLVTKGSPIKTRLNNLVGFISRQVIEKALFHKLGQAPVADYTTTEIAIVDSDADLAKIQEKIIDNKQRILPVVDHDIIKGVITRTNLLDILVKNSINKTDQLPGKIDVNARTRNVVKFMRERLPERILDILETIGRVVDKTGCKAFVVGGFVRDLFLYKKNEDIDIVIEGDGIAFAKQYSKLVGGRVHYYKKFGTAIITHPDGFKIDVASARLEYYKFPAAMPTVEMSSIKLDLFRRDFTINTLTIQLSPDKFGTLIDFFSGQRDIKDKTVRVLHNLSFVEDPTRVFRAIRFEQRYGFTIGKLTSNLIENAVKMDIFKRLSGKRVFSELRQILQEDDPRPAIKRLAEYDLLKVIHKTIKLNQETVELLNSINNVLSWYDLLYLEESYMQWAVYFLALIRRSNQYVSDEICKKLELPPELNTFLSKKRIYAESSLSLLEKNRVISNSMLYNQLSPLRTELILYMMASAREERIQKAISGYFTKLKYIKISITGKDLINIGLKPGPLFKKILQAVFDAKLNGIVKTRKEELEFLSNYVS